MFGFCVYLGIAEVAGKVGGLDGGGGVVHVVMQMCARRSLLRGVVFSAQPWWADVMLGSGLGFVLSFGSC